MIMDWVMALAVIITLMVILPLSPLLAPTEHQDNISDYIVRLLHALAVTAIVFVSCRAANIPLLAANLIYLSVGVAGLLVGRIQKPSKPLNAPSRWAVLAVIVMIIFITSSTYFANERLLARRDEGLYFNYAAYLSNAGRWIVDFQLWNPLSLPLPEFAQVLDTLPGMFVMEGRAEFQAPGAYPILLSHFYTLFGFEGTIAVGALFFALGCYQYFDYWKQRQRPLLGLLLLVALLFNLPSLWLARTTLSETMLAANAAAAIFAILRTIQTNGKTCRRDYYFSILQIATLPLWKIEGSSIAAVLICLLAYLICTRENPLSTRDYYAVVIYAIVITFISTTLFYFGSPLYVKYHLQYQILSLAALFVAGMLSVPIRLFTPLLIGPSKQHVVIAASRIIFITALISLVIYCIFYRPYLEEPHLIVGHPVESVNGMRDFREYSFLNLIDYLGWPSIVFGLFAISLHLIKKGTDSAATLGISALIMISVGSYIYAPMISPDQIWGSRRAIALCIPMILLAASLGFESVFTRYADDKRAHKLLMVITGIVFLTPAWNASGFWDAKENSELNQQLLSMNMRLSNSDAVITDSYVMAIVLGTRFKRPVAYASTPQRLIDYARFAKQAGKRPLLVTQQSMANPNLVMQWQSAPITGTIRPANRAKDLQFSEQISEEIFVYALSDEK
jgi:hypothetical protein